MKKFFLMVTVTIILILNSCMNNGSNYSKGSIEDQIQEGINEYLIADVKISEESPAEGYHSPKEALFNTAVKVIDYGLLDIQQDRNNETNEWLYDCKIEEPILVNNFSQLYPDNRCDYYYVIYGSHPEYGAIGGAIYEYNENSEILWGAGELNTPRIPTNDELETSWYDTISEKEASELFSSRTNINHTKPIAVLLATDYHIDQMNFSWYFEVPDGRGNHEEYLLNSAIKGVFSPENIRGITEKVEIVKIKNNLNLLDHAAKVKSAINKRSFSGISDIPLLSSDDFEPVP